MSSKKAFRKLLVRLASSLGKEDVKKLVFMELEGEGEEEESDAIKVFELLIKRNVISHDKVGVLAEMMKDIQRVDLMEEVKRWIEEAERSADGSAAPEVFTGEELDLALLRKVSRDVARDWKMLARRLGVEEPDIEDIHRGHQSELLEASYQSLLKWRKDSGTKATPRALKKALTDMKLMSVVHQYFSLVV